MRQICEKGNPQLYLENYSTLNHTNFAAPTDNYQVYDVPAIRLELRG